MERCTLTATSFNGSLAQRPTYQTTDISPPYTRFQSKSNFKDASFSSYLLSNTAATAAKPSPATASGNRADDTEISIFEAKQYFNENPDQKQIKTSQPLDRIAERCDLSTAPRLSSVSSVDGFGRNCRTGSFHATPTASSEASWNSQSGLLSNPPGSISISMKSLPLNGQRRGPSSSRKWLFGRKCPCSGKKSIDVEEKFPEPKHPIHLNSNSNGSVNLKKQSFKAGEAVSMEEGVKESQKGIGIEEMAKLKLVAGSWATDQELTPDSGSFSPENGIAAEIGHRIVPSGRSFGDMGGFTFPILNPPAAGKLLGASPASQLEELPRESLEVFRPAGDAGIVRKSMEFQHRGTVPLPGDNGRRSFTFPASPKGRAAVMDDDVASDSSSDLFEIESFSTQATSYQMYRCRDSLDEVSSYEGRRFGAPGLGVLQFRRSLDDTTTSIAPTECYEPSEVSVDWSVTTAEGFDRSSAANFSTAASEYEEIRFTKLESEKVTSAAGGGVAKRKSNGLLSCRCEKAVSVGPQPVKCGPDHQRIGPPSFPIESARISAMSRLATVSSAHAARVAASSDKPPLARSHSARIARTIVTR